jgi:hypothetical protein
LPGDITGFGPLTIQAVDIGDSLVVGDHTGPGAVLVSIPTGSGVFSINLSNEGIRNAVQNAVTSGRTYFQVRLRFNIGTDYDSSEDQIQFDFANASLIVDSQ